MRLNEGTKNILFVLKIQPEEEELGQCIVIRAIWAKMGLLLLLFEREALPHLGLRNPYYRRSEYNDLSGGSAHSF